MVRKFLEKEFSCMQDKEILKEKLRQRAEANASANVSSLNGVTDFLRSNSVKTVSPCGNGRYYVVNQPMIKITGLR